MVVVVVVVETTEHDGRAMELYICTRNTDVRIASGLTKTI